MAAGLLVEAAHVGDPLGRKLPWPWIGERGSRLACRCLRFTPVGIAPGDGNVEHPLPALLFWFEQTLLLERQHVLLHPLNLLAGHAATLDIYGDSSQVRGSGFARFGGRIAIVAA